MGFMRSYGVRVAGFCALAAACSVAFADALTDRARAMLERRQAKEAYQLLLPQESARAGDPEFDYLLGIAALDSGDPERAVFALERVLAVQPNNHVARAEIARAYMAMGERDAARSEFEAVRAQAIPADAKANIDRFLSAIRAAETTRVDGFIELGGGYDTNVNAATASIAVAVPAIGGLSFELDPLSRARDDFFGMLSGGVNVTHRLNPAWSLVGGASGMARLHKDETQVDQLLLDGNFGARWLRDKNAVTVGAQIQSFELDYARFRETTGVVAQWQHYYDQQRQVSVFGQHSQLRYPTQSIRDATRRVVGVAYAQQFNVTYSPVLFASAYAGGEDERATGVPHLGHDLWGMRLGGQLRLGQGWGLLGNASYEQRDYGGIDPLFSEQRKDRQTDLSGGVTYLLRANTVVTAQVAHTDNRSNIAINKYDRTVTSVSIRFHF